jgi:hypothetical protein
MSRVDSVQIAVRKAGDRVKGSVLASDAFFPFRDNVDAAAAAGVKALKPGASSADAGRLRLRTFASPDVAGTTSRAASATAPPYFPSLPRIIFI